MWIGHTSCVCLVIMMTKLRGSNVTFCSYPSDDNPMEIADATKNHLNRRSALDYDKICEIVDHKWSGADVGNVRPCGFGLPRVPRLGVWTSRGTWE
jgi:hypothetical protein